jgi:hypothetical protein
MASDVLGEARGGKDEVLAMAVLGRKTLEDTELQSF